MDFLRALPVRHTLRLLYVTAFVACGSGVAQPGKAPVRERAVKLDPKQCRPLKIERQTWLGPEWKPYLEYVRICDVKQGNAPVLYVVAVSAEDFYAKLPQSAPAVKFPKPMLLSPSGKTLGRLPINFPDDPPRTVELTFDRWAAGLPHRIRIWVEDPTVAGNRFLPSLEWDPATGTYTPGEVADHGR